MVKIVSPLALALIFAGSLMFGFPEAGAVEAGGFVEDFNEGPGSEALKNFVLHDGSASGLGFGATLGTGKSGGVLLGWGSVGNEFHRMPGSDDPTFYSLADMADGAEWVTSVDFTVKSGTSGPTVLTFGFTADADPGALTKARGVNIAGSIIRNEGSEVFRMRMRNDSADIDGMEFPQETLVPEEWYRLVLKLRKSGSAAVDYELALFSLGEFGASDPTALTNGTTELAVRGTVSGSPVMAESNLQWAIDARNAPDGTGIHAIDNCTLTLIE